MNEWRAFNGDWRDALQRRKVNHWAVNTFTGINGDWLEIEEVDGVKAGVSSSSFQEEITRTFIDPVIQEQKSASNGVFWKNQLNLLRVRVSAMGTCSCCSWDYVIHSECDNYHHQVFLLSFFPSAIISKVVYDWLEEVTNAISCSDAPAEDDDNDDLRFVVELIRGTISRYGGEEEVNGDGYDFTES